MRRISGPRAALLAGAALALMPVAALMFRYNNPDAVMVLLMMAAVGVLLLLACVNVASMLLARSATRRREMAMRVALGAGRLRIIRQVLTESLLLATLGGGCGVLLAYFGAHAMVTIIGSGRSPVGMPQPLQIPVHLDLGVLLFAAGAAVATGVLFGLAPAWHAFVSAPSSSPPTVRYRAPSSPSYS